MLSGETSATPRWHREKPRHLSMGVVGTCRTQDKGFLLPSPCVWPDVFSTLCAPKIIGVSSFICTLYLVFLFSFESEKRDAPVHSD